MGNSLDRNGSEDQHSGISLFSRTLLETRDYKGRPTLHFATRTVVHAQLLLERGARINNPDSVLKRRPLLFTGIVIR